MEVLEELDVLELVEDPVEVLELVEVFVELADEVAVKEALADTDDTNDGRGLLEAKLDLVDVRVLEALAVGKIICPIKLRS